MRQILCLLIVLQTFFCSAGMLFETGTFPQIADPITILTEISQIFFENLSFFVPLLNNSAYLINIKKDY